MALFAALCVKLGQYGQMPGSVGILHLLRNEDFFFSQARVRLEFMGNEKKMRHSWCLTKKFSTIYETCRS